MDEEEYECPHCGGNGNECEWEFSDDEKQAPCGEANPDYDWS